MAILVISGWGKVPGIIAKPSHDAEDIDHSETLSRQAVFLANGDASENLIADSLAERDVNLARLAD